MEEGHIIITGVADLDFLSLFEILGDDESKYYVDKILKEVNYLSSQNFIDTEEIVAELHHLYNIRNQEEFEQYYQLNDIFADITEKYNPSNNQMIELFTTIKTVYFSSYNDVDTYNNNRYDDNYEDSNDYNNEY